MPASRADAATPEWHDWTWQMQQRVRDAEGLARFVHMTRDEQDAIALLGERFHFVITPYYAALMDPEDPECPIRRQVVPQLISLGGHIASIMFINRWHNWYLIDNFQIKTTVNKRVGLFGIIRKQPDLFYA